MSKMLCLGMSLTDVVAASTVNAAVALKRMEYGTLKVGALGDATVLAVRDGAFDYVDTRGETLTGAQRITAEGVVLKGRWWHPA